MSSRALCSFARRPLLTLASTGSACTSAINLMSRSVAPAVSLLTVMVLEAAGTTPIQVGARQSDTVQTPLTTSGSRAKLTYSSVTAYWPGGRLVGVAYQSRKLILTVNVCEAVVINARSGEPSEKEIGKPSGMRSASMAVDVP